MQVEWNGVAKSNEAHEITTIDGFTGPIMIQVESDGADGKEVGISFAKTSDLTSPLTTDQDTVTTAENTGYTGNAATLDFTAQALNNVPIIPKTVEVKPTAGGDTVNCKDLNGDGILYTSDVDLDDCGRVDYHSGAIELHYPAGKAPNTGVISADYKYTKTIKARGTVSYRINNMKPDEQLKIYARAETGDSVALKITVFGS